jgi:2-polyprenyl-3-methyl-5-hydroxy-6-metoxy-1,4-benzoquinol methylase
MQVHDLLDVLTRVANQYPEDLVEEQLRDIPRIAFNIRIAVEAAKPRHHRELEICDLGGGIGLFSAGCAAYGMKRSVLIDDFDDSVNHRVGGSILDLHTSLGVEVIARDVVDKGIADIEGSFDIITTFESMEHWHHSPRRLFRQAINKLKPGGVFVLSVPNCVNLRKRITIPIGWGKWSAMQEWYDADRFRGHVREPDVSDLIYIANDMGLTAVKVLGRNWQGYSSTNSVIRLVARVMDYPLRVRPQLCADLYLVGQKA